MATKTCTFCLEERPKLNAGQIRFYEGELFFKTKNNNLYKCFFHNEYMNKDDYIIMTAKEREDLKDQNREDFKKLNIDVDL